MFYFFGIIATFIYLTQEHKTNGRKDLIYAFCVSLVWPVLAVGLAFYYKEELGFTIADLLGFSFNESLLGEYDVWVPPAQEFETDTEETFRR